MAWWQRIFKRSAPPASVEQRVTAAITRVLHQQRLLGEVLLQLPRVPTNDFAGAASLAWSGDQLVLKVNQQLFDQLRMDEAELLLEHLALHVVWEHPARYTGFSHPGLVKMATDIAVNQYLPSAPAGTVTLEQVERLLRKKLPAKQDSQEYLRILKQVTPEEQERLRAVGFKFRGQQAGRLTAPGANRPIGETHAGWRSARRNGNGCQRIRLAKLRHLVKQAWQQTSQRDRGLLPGAVQQQLAGPLPTVMTPLWQKILRQQLGKIARGRQDSYNRFNRRQPLRMDLPGQVSRLIPEVYLFIDNSGSVPDRELKQALAAVAPVSRAFLIFCVTTTLLNVLWW